MDNATMEAAGMEAAYNRYRLSWLAYFRPLIRFGVTLFVAAFLSIAHVYAMYAVAAFGASTLVYQILLIQSVVLYTNSEGVWVYSGILPWAKGVGGVRWRDVDDAGYIPGFLGWAFKAYTVRIGHRFTRGNEIVLRHVKGGDQAASHINDLHGSYLYNQGGQ